MDLDQPQMMPVSAAAAGDRLSKLSDVVLGHILSFLPAKEAARAAVLSSRWRHTFAAVHTVSLVEPDAPVVDYKELARYSTGWRPPLDPNQPPPFTNVVSAALLARHRRWGDAATAAAPPLRALRVSTVGYGRSDASLVDQWITYAVNQADPAVGLDLDLRLRREPLCDKAYSLRRRGACANAGHADQDTGDVDDARHKRRWRSRSPAEYACIGFESSEEAMLSPCYSRSSPSPSPSPPRPHRRCYRYSSPSPSRPTPHRRCSPQGCDVDDDDDDDDDVISSDEKSTRGYDYTPAVHVVPSGLFSCAALSSLSLGSFRLATPAAIALPSLETLLLAHVSDPGSDVQRLISGCPRLADLTLEACDTVTGLTVAGLRRLALRCCHALRTVAIDASSEPHLQAFEYRGSVPDDTFLTIHGGGGGLSSLTSVAYCKIDICGEEVTSSSELAKLSAFLHLFAGAQHLHLESARLGSGLDDAAAFATLPAFSTLSHLELRGYLPDDDDAAATFAALTRILERAPNLETLSLVFHPEPLDDGDDAKLHSTYYREEELYDKHLLSYNRHSVLAAPGAAMAPACLRRRVREINLVHYQGGTAQRTLAMYLLRNAPAISELGCELAMGPLWIQDELTRELEGWVMNKAAIVNFG